VARKPRKTGRFCSFISFKQVERAHLLAAMRPCFNVAALSYWLRSWKKWMARPVFPSGSHSGGSVVGMTSATAYFAPVFFSALSTALSVCGLDSQKAEAESPVPIDCGTSAIIFHPPSRAQ
jgi:hypothetical protein